MNLASVLLISVLLFVIGAILGSFLNVVMYRSLAPEPRRKREKWYRGRSRCDSCGRQIAWFDNIPVLSYLILRGRCRSCSEPIGVSHIAVEILMGSLFVWWFMVGFAFFRLVELAGSPLAIVQPVFWLVVGIIMLFLLLIDLRYYLLPDFLVGTLTMLTVGYRLTLTILGVMRVEDLILAAGCALAGFLFLGSLWLFTRGRGMGLGDVKLMIPLGFLLGWPSMLVMLFLAFVMGGFVGGGLVVFGKKTIKQVVPFGPFLVIATWMTLVAGDTLVKWYLGLLGW